MVGFSSSLASLCDEILKLKTTNEARQTRVVNKGLPGISTSPRVYGEVVSPVVCATKIQVKDNR